MLGKVFVIDDERIVADTLAEILRRFGYDASLFYDAESAIAEMESAPPNVVITDVEMPGIGGLVLAVLIRQRLPDCRVFLSSGQVTTFDLLEEIQNQGFCATSAKMGQFESGS